MYVIGFGEPKREARQVTAYGGKCPIPALSNCLQEGSWLERFGSSLCGVCLGLALFIGSFVLLGWNELRSVRMSEWGDVEKCGRGEKAVLVIYTRVGSPWRRSVPGSAVSQLIC